MKISCVMAVGQRPHFLAQALRCFSHQTYPDRELIVVDDGEESSARACRGRAGVRHLRLRGRTPTGAKYNAGFEAATGELMQKLDDDDFYGPHFLETMVGRMARSRSARTIAAWGRFHILLLSGEGAPSLHDSGRGWFAGGTLCFRRGVWRDVPFREVARDEDAFFLEDHGGPRLAIHNAARQYILVRHGANTWQRMRSGAGVDRFLAEMPVASRGLTDLVGPAVDRFYRGLAAEGPGG